MSLYKPKRTMVTDEATLAFGVCVWRLPNGNYIQNDEGDYLNMQGTVGDISIEKKMRDFVNIELNIMEGNTFWLPGFRQISQSEWEDQMERLQEGKIPDPVDVYRQITNGEHT